LVTLFDDHLHAVFDSWNSSTSLDTDAFSGSHSMRVNVASAWGGQLFHHSGGYSTNDYGALTFAVKSDTPNFDIFPYVETTDGQLLFGGVRVSNYIYNGDITNEWKVVWIPLRDLTNDQTVEIVNLYLEFNQPGVVWLDEVKVVEGLWFPLCDTTPYTATVSAVFDNDRSYGRVQAYNGDAADTYVGCENKAGGASFPVGDCDIWYRQYVREDEGGNRIPFNPSPYIGEYAQVLNDMTILDYDQHAGYDYPKPAGTPVHAATSGTLCFDINTTTKRNGLWRNTAECPYVKAAYSSGAYNSFYIVHENTLLTRYLHGEGDYYGLTKKVYDQIVAKGYAAVYRGQHIGYVGHAGFTSGDHLHFETEMQGQLVDPYRLRQTLPIGSGVLWTADPPQ
jgi:murein DD-endopeptidase MepM/ murein hydrolase activator NlpD